MDLNKLKQVVDEMQFINESIKNNSLILLDTNSKIAENINQFKKESALLNTQKDAITKLSGQLDSLNSYIGSDDLNAKTIKDNADMISSSISNYDRKMELMLQKFEHKSHRFNSINLIPWILISLLIGSIVTSTLIQYYQSPINQSQNIIQPVKGY